MTIMINTSVPASAHPSTPTLGRSPPTSPSPASPVRPGRLRGLSYLRNYTSNHLLSRESHHHSHTGTGRTRPALTRAHSTPSAAAANPAAAAATTETAPSPTAGTVAPSSLATPQDAADVTVTASLDPVVITSTSGWVPTVGGHSGLSRMNPEPQATPASPTSHPASSAAMARTRSEGASASLASAQITTRAPVDRAQNEAQTPDAAARPGPRPIDDLPSIRFTAYQDPRAQRPSLTFSPMGRILPTGKEIIKVGRFSERDNQPNNTGNIPSASPIGFKSKVVSRRHCEFWYTGGRWHIKDVKSSSGTFLNHVRLSSPGVESKPYAVKDGDIVQLGIDFKGGEEMIFRCVKIRVELNKGAHPVPSSFSVQSHKRLRELNSLPQGSTSSQDCAICLGPIAPCQSLFVAPCSHTWHYKCIRVIINGPHWPQFMCPNCRAVADLEEEFDYPAPAAKEEWEDLNVEAPAPETTESATPRNPPATAPEPTTPPIQTPRIPDADVLESRDRSSLELRDPDNSEVVEVSDDSEELHRLSVGEMENLHINDEAPSPISSVGSNALEPSSSTVLPVDIATRPSATHRGSSHRERPDRSSSPHPPSWTPDGFAPNEGPMTPRNDVGPFVFDGSGERIPQPAGLSRTLLTQATRTPTE